MLQRVRVEFNMPSATYCYDLYISLDILWIGGSDRVLVVRMYVFCACYIVRQLVLCIVPCFVHAALLYSVLRYIV